MYNTYGRYFKSTHPKRTYLAETPGEENAAIARNIALESVTLEELFF